MLLRWFRLPPYRGRCLVLDGQGSGMPNGLPKAAVTVKPASARTYETWLSLAKSHCPLKYIVPTGSGSEQYQLINVVDKRHA